MHAPFYETPDKGSHTEKEDVKPIGVLGTWWHETIRALAAIEESVGRVLAYQFLNIYSHTPIASILLSSVLVLSTAHTSLARCVSSGQPSVDITTILIGWLISVDGYHRSLRLWIYEETNEEFVSQLFSFFHVLRLTAPVLQMVSWERSHAFYTRL